MKTILCIAVTLFALASCQKNDTGDNSRNKLSGRYAGIFSRTGMDTVAVTISFKENGSFEGSGEISTYPALCKGHFREEDNKLMVDDSCTWTANFDWSLIFDGNYILERKNDRTIRIWRTTGTANDEYVLEKNFR